MKQGHIALAQTNEPNRDNLIHSEFVLSQAESNNLVTLRQIQIIGSSIYGADQFNPIVKPLEGQSARIEVLIKDLEKVAELITQLYLNDGYLNSRAVFQAQDFDPNTGIASIQVIEGGIESIMIEGAGRLKNYVNSRLELGAGTPLNVRKLEDQLRLLKADPLIENIEATLKAGTGVGQSILVVRVTEADPFVGSFGIDNYSPPSVGADRLGLNLAYLNLTGIGDRISVSYYPRIESFTGTYQLEFDYQAPVNAMNGKIKLTALIDRNETVSGDFQDLDISAESDWYEINFRQPLILNPREELALGVGFTYRDGQTFTFQGPTPFGFGPDDNGITRTSVFNFSQEYILRDITGAWALRSQFKFGTDLFDATTNASPIPDSEFFSWLAQFQRIQVLGDDNFLIMQGDVQLTPNTLLPSEQFVIGGAQSVRGYRQNARSGDNGIRFSIEDRIILIRDIKQEPVFILAPFFDLGYVWNTADNPNTIPPQQFLAGLGLGILWQPIENLNIRLDYAPPLINLEDRGDNIQDYGFYFSTNYSF